MHHRLPSLNALRAFDAVARHGSVLRAAEALHVTHGAISRHLHALEEELGCALVRREGRGLALTPAGRQLAGATDDALRRLHDACERARRDASNGPLVLGCAASVLARWIIPRLPRLEADLPQLRLHLSPQENPPDATLSGLDAALLLAAPPWPTGWHALVLAPERIGPVLAPQHPAAEALRNTDPHALLGLDLLHTTSRPQAWPEWALRNGLPPESLRMGAGFAHLYYLLEAAVAGLGIAIAPEPLVREDIARGRLLAPFGFVETDARWILCARNDGPRPHLTSLARWMQAQLA